MLNGGGQSSGHGHEGVVVWEGVSPSPPGLGAVPLRKIKFYFADSALWCILSHFYLAKCHANAVPLYRENTNTTSLLPYIIFMSEFQCRHEEPPLKFQDAKILTFLANRT